jgi:hypothetical protein
MTYPQPTEHVVEFERPRHGRPLSPRAALLVIVALSLGLWVLIGLAVTALL